jgi:hypothetical protein
LIVYFEFPRKDDELLGHYSAVVGRADGWYLLDPNYSDDLTTFSKSSWFENWTGKYLMVRSNSKN